MTWVKVCGLREERDVSAAVDAGADALGFVLDETSPRRISVERAARLMDDVPILRVLITTDMAPDEIERVVDETGANAVQVYGRHAEESAGKSVAAGLFVLRPVSMSVTPPEPDPARVPDSQTVVLDSARGNRIGGTGVAFDWDLIPDLGRPFVLAGGLNPDNVAGAIRTVRPWGVDASSGLESERGVKDTSRVVAFIEQAKEA